MTEDKHFKALVRARKARTGESYQQARAALLKRQSWFKEMDETPGGKRVAEWMERTWMATRQNGFMGESPHRDIRASVNLDPTYAQFESAVRQGVEVMKSNARKLIKRTAIRRSLAEVRLLEDHHLYIGAGTTDDPADDMCLYFLDKTKTRPLVYPGGPLGILYDVEDREPSGLQDWVHDSLRLLGSSYFATDAHNGCLSVEAMGDNPLTFFDARGVPRDFFGVDLALVSNPDHLVIEDGIPYCDDAVLIDILDDDDGITATLIEADALSYARSAVTYYYELQELDHQLHLLLGDARADVVRALLRCKEGGVTTLPIAAPVELAIERLLRSPESTNLDFKERHYRIVGATDGDKSEFLKDVLAFANTPRTADAVIVLGARDRPGERAVVVGVPEEDLVDDASLQQLVNSKTNRPVRFAVETITIDGRLLVLIRIPAEQDGPLYATRRFGRVDAQTVYKRRGSGTVVASPDEIAVMAARSSESGTPPKGLDD